MPKPIGTRRRRNRESILSFVVDAKAPIAPHWLDEMPMLVARHRERIANESCCVGATEPVDSVHGIEKENGGRGPAENVPCERHDARETGDPNGNAPGDGRPLSER